MFIDWLRVSQTFDHDLPTVCDIYNLTIDATSHEILSTSQPRFQHKGSFSSSISVSIQGRKLTVDGNPSRINRLDNLFGFDSIDSCIRVYNAFLAEYGLPAFTRCTEVLHRCSTAKSDRCAPVVNGATIERIDLTTNVSLGKGNVLAYLRGVSTQSVERSVGFLYPNGRTVAWTSQGGGKGGRMQYRKAYDKAFEMTSTQGIVPKIKRLFGESSPEYAYVMQVHAFCIEQGICRFEQELKSEFLRKKGFCFWGLFDESDLIQLHREFLNLDDKLQVTAMDLNTISEHLLYFGHVTSIRSANTAAMYAINWANGQSFDLTKSQVKIHRATLRKVGIDIKHPYDNTRSVTVIVREAREVFKSFDLAPPSWYQLPVAPSHLRAVR